MRSFFALAGLVAVAFAGKTITQTATVEVTVTSCEAAPTDCNEWEETVVATATATASPDWSDAPVAGGEQPTWSDVPVAGGAQPTWSDAAVPAVTPVAAASSWVEVPVPGTSTAVAAGGPVASYTKPAIATFTGGASTMAGAGLAGVAAFAALLL